jgi:predicted ABC-type ATPase
LSTQPVVVVLAGPNGAGKSTVASALLHDALGVDEFVNADVIAGGLSAFNSGAVFMAAGRIMLRRVKDLAAQRVSFAFETTLASRSFAPWLEDLADSGFGVHIVFLWLSSPDLALQRVADRVRMGGHDVPPETVRRRYAAGLRNFFDLYEPIATTWSFYDASGPRPRLIAERLADNPAEVYDGPTWRRAQDPIRR